MAEEIDLVHTVGGIFKIKRLSEIDKQIAEMQQQLQENPDSKDLKTILRILGMQRQSLIYELTIYSRAIGKNVSDQELASAVEEGLSAGVIMSLCGCKIERRDNKPDYVAIYDDDKHFAKKGRVACMYDKYILGEKQKEIILTTAIESSDIASSLHYMIDEGHVNLYNAAQAMIHNMQTNQALSHDKKAYADLANHALNEMLKLVNDYIMEFGKDGTIVHETLGEVLDRFKKELTVVVSAAKKTM